MGKIILGRHGESEDNADGILAGSRDSPLTIRGAQHAVELVGNIHSMPNLRIGRIVTSPLKRALATGQIASREFTRLYQKEVTVSVRKGLMERHFGCCEGIPVSEICERATSWRCCESDSTVIYLLDAPEAEPIPVMIERSKKQLAHLKEMADRMEDDLLVVAHYGINYLMYLEHSGRHWEDFFKMPFLHNGHFLIIEP